MTPLGAPRRIAVVVHPHRPLAGELAKIAEQWWAERDAVVITDASEEGPRPELFGADIDLAISLGGDGTILRTVALAAREGIPVLGVNLGNLGYLTTVEPDEITQAFELLYSGDYTVEDRMLLDVTITTALGTDQTGVQRTDQTGVQTSVAQTLVGETSVEQTATEADGVIKRSYVAMNEVVVEKTSDGHTIHLGVKIGDDPFLTYAADGILIATPTGSTAYNLSLRGPIVSPRMRALVLTPIAPHMLFDRSLVIEPDLGISLELLVDREAIAVIDGERLASLQPGDLVEVRASSVSARMIKVGDRGFYEILQSKFGLLDR